MASFLVTDIFGCTEPLLELADALKIPAHNIIDPYQAQAHAFADEQHAYDYFQTHVGLEQYADHVKTKLDTAQNSEHVIAFSMGAAALWKLAPSLSANKVKKLTLFYGAQIRHMTTLSPAVPTHIILPKYEPHFDINSLANDLRPKANVTLQSTPYLHGFMNPLSSNFNQAAYQHYTTKLADET